MRIIVTQNMTVDGRVEMLDDWFDPAADDADLSAELMEQSAAEEVLLLGRRTFLDFRGYWPHQTDDTTGVAAHLDRVDKQVVSSTLREPEWQNSTLVGDDPIAVARRLRERPGGDVVVTGSIQLAHALIAAELVDEYRMFVYPAWQGRGRGFFPDGHAAPPMRMLRSRAFVNGVVYTTYEPIRPA